MHEPLRIELADQARAASLARELCLFHPEVVDVEGRAELRIELIAHNPERRVEEVLHRIDAWLARSGEEGVRVHLDGRAYTLQPAPER